MKGFIEVRDLQDLTYCINVFSIVTFYNANHVTIITKGLVSRYECSNENLEITVKESYEEIKELIKKAQE